MVEVIVEVVVEATEKSIVEVMVQIIYETQQSGNYNYTCYRYISIVASVKYNLYFFL